MIGLTPSIASGRAFSAFTGTRNFLSGIVYGVLVIMLLYNALVYFLVRESLFLAYSGALAALTFAHLTTSGVGCQYLWPNHPELNVDFIRMSIGIALTAIVWMASTYLKVSTWSRQLDLAIRASALAALTVSALPTFKLIGLLPSLAMLLAAPLVCKWTTWQAVRLGIVGARAFAVIRGLFLSTFLLGAGRAIGVVPMCELAVRTSDLSLMAVIVVTSLGLAKRINQEKLAKQVALSSADAKKRIPREPESQNPYTHERHCRFH